MGFDLSVETTTYSGEDQSWLGSAHGTNNAWSATLDASLFVGTFTDGVVPSGVVLGRLNASPGKLVPYTDAATHGAGSDTAVGHLLTTTDLGGTTAGTAKDVAVAVIDHGRVIEANLPTGHGLTAAAKADLTHMRYA